MKGANMNDNPKAASTQESIASHFDLADIADPAEREQLLMEELRRTQNALSKAKDEISRKQRALAERAFEQEARRRSRNLSHAACWTADFDEQGNPTGFWFSDECRRVLGYETEEGLPGNGGSSDRFIAPDDLARINSEFRIAWQRRAVPTTSTTACGAKDGELACGYRAAARFAARSSRALRALVHGRVRGHRRRGEESSAPAAGSFVPDSGVQVSPAATAFL